MKIEKKILKNKIKKNKKLIFQSDKNISLSILPTTAGSGAENTCFSVLYIDKNKFSILGRYKKKLINIFYIPELLLSLSKSNRAYSGFDAIAQAIESLLSNKQTYISRNFAKKSLKLSLKNYIQFVTNPKIENSKNMLEAASLAGKAINISKTTGPHALSYYFSSLYRIAHGHAVAMSFVSFLEFNFNNISKAKDINIKNNFNFIFNISDTNNIKDLKNYFKNLLKRSGIITDYQLLKIDIQKDYKKIILNVNLERLKNNFIKVNNNDLKKIILRK